MERLQEGALLRQVAARSLEGRRLTRDDNFFEDFEEGETIVHPRGRTVSEAEHMMLTNLVLNTAQLHFNQAMCDESPAACFDGRRVVYGGIVFAFVYGLASEETSENAIQEISFDEGRHKAPVFAGDTLFAESTVLEKRDSPDHAEAGIVKMLLLGKNQRGEVVLEITREILVRRRGHA
ncbi:Mesaconyl-CoA hydratase [Vulgatibacter incomptus]|uniref:Mesaconyl-CoA hydratase n=2 Tax=Vulgatibacter incomptus TaxID=1391653 RepID=A0A0K1PA47_9BACT|nr:Mesaconyl-CoA hydratase [Vulgatibacter incomptus]